MISTRFPTGTYRTKVRFQFSVRVMNMFKHSFTSMICGTIGCSKTSFCVLLIANQDELFTVPLFRDFVWCFSEDSAIPRELLPGAARRITYQRGIPDFDKASNGQWLVVLEDLLNEAYSAEVCVVFTKGSHLWKISVILITEPVPPGAF